jgi:agmatinase
MQEELKKLNRESEKINSRVFDETTKILKNGKIPGIIGGDHSVPLGALQAVGEKYPEFGVLQLDAHLDLRNSYEGFTFSHASVFYNALKIKSLSKLVQVGIRDYCDEEVDVIQNEGERISVFFDHDLKENQFKGKNRIIFMLVLMRTDWIRNCVRIQGHRFPADWIFSKLFIY